MNTSPSLERGSVKKKTKTLDSFILEEKEKQKLRQQAEEEARRNFFYLNTDGVSDDCYEWWLVVLKHYDYKLHDPLPIWMKELFIPW